MIGRNKLNNVKDELIVKAVGVRNVGGCLIPREILLQALQLPDGHEIIGAEWDWISRCVRLFIEGPKMPVVKAGAIIPYINTQVQIGIEYSIDSETGAKKTKHTYEWRFDLD